MPSAPPPSLHASSALPCGARPPRMSRSRSVRTQPHVALPHRHLTQPHRLLSSYLYYFLRAERRRTVLPPTPDILRSDPGWWSRFHRHHQRSHSHVRGRPCNQLHCPCNPFPIPRLTFHRRSGSSSHLVMPTSTMTSGPLMSASPLHFLALASQQTPLRLGLPPPDPAAMVMPLCPTPAATRTFRLSVARFPVQRVPSPPSPPDSLAWTAPRNTGERAAASSQVKVSLPLPDPTRSAEHLVGVLVVMEVEPALERLPRGDARRGNRSGPGQGEPPSP
jgi:hypothetical protein